MSWKTNSRKSHISEKSWSNIEEGLKVSTSVSTMLPADGGSLGDLRDGFSLDIFLFSLVALEALASRSRPFLWSTTGWSVWLLPYHHHLFAFSLVSPVDTPQNINTLIYGFSAAVQLWRPMSPTSNTMWKIRPHLSNAALIYLRFYLRIWRGFLYKNQDFGLTDPWS